MQLHRSIWGLAFAMSICLTCWSSVALAQRADNPEENSVIKVFPLSHATAHEMANLIDSIFGDDLIGLAADKRSNSLIVRVPSASLTEMIAAVLDELDEPVDSGANRSKNKTAARVPRAANQVAVHSEVSSTIVSLVGDGTKVKKGDLLVQLDDSKLGAEIQTLQIEAEELKAGQLSMKKVKDQTDGTSSSELLITELQIAEMRQKQNEAEFELDLITVESEISVARQAIEVLQKRQKRLEQLAKTGQVTTEALDELAWEVIRSKAEYDVAAAKRKLLVSTTRPLRTAAAELEIVRSRLALETAKRDEGFRRQVAEAKLSALRIQLDRKLQRLERLEQQQANCKVYAPIDGVVRYGSPLLKPGALVRERQLLLVLDPK